MGKTSKFLLIKEHTDAEITLVLQKQAKAGLWLSECKGNWFIFNKKLESKEQVCCHTVHAPNFGIVAEDVIDEEKDAWTQEGWQMFCKGALQDVQDSRRQVFLYSEDPTSKIIEEPDTSRNAAIKRGLTKGLSNLAVCLAYLAVACYGIITGKLEAFMFAIALATGLVSSVLCALSVAYSLKLKKDYSKTLQSGHYYYIDLATVATSFTLIILALYLGFSIL